MDQSMKPTKGTLTKKKSPLGDYPEDMFFGGSKLVIWVRNFLPIFFLFFSLGEERARLSG